MDPEDTKTSVKHQVSHTAKKAAVQKRAEGRAKVLPKFRDSFKHFFFSPTGALKILRLGLLIGALACFITTTAHESYIAITVLGICIVLFFILSYMLTLHHLVTYLDWPLLDLINSLITAVFLLIVAALAIQEKERRHLFYVGGSLCLTAAIACLISATLVTKKMRNEVKKVLGIKIETRPVPAQAPTLAPSQCSEGRWVRLPQEAMARALTPPWSQPTRSEGGSSGYSPGATLRGLARR
ncbi:PREDICTED: CKLF-like MARVEL transmembrane domain-containing protein 1 [Ceratotherium simum simum]|uniref:CKLF-like MARVEL transmembrane domain-containing protein 1 n=1 Tax=Ceratotherium simum simum TaxID=73337 RepID=A0ABM1CWY8_CERSS|nr:PREDICTED: CKLF-like MARVEL transmembrane domain-containing protein 1 [Ceratotherium simum simum]